VILFLREHHTSGLLFCEDGDCKRSRGCCGEGVEGDSCSWAIISLVWWPRGVCLERSCVTRAMPRAPKFEPRTAPSLVKQRTRALVINSSHFFAVTTLPFPSGSQNAADREHSLNQKQDTKERSSLAQAVRRICSGKV